LIQTADGKCLGRLQTKEPIANPLAFILSPDARNLLIMTEKKYEDNRPKPLPDGTYEFYSGLVWDLTTGTTEAFPFGTLRANQYKDLHHAGWMTPDHIAVFTNMLNLYDVKAKAMTAYFRGIGIGQLVSETPWMRTDAGGRAWVHRAEKPAANGSTPAVWLPVTLPESSAPFFDPARVYAQAARTPLSIEVDFKKRDRSRNAAQAVADAMTARGYLIGESGWKLRIAYEQSNQHTTLTGGARGDLKLYWARITWSLIGPNGGPPAWKYVQESSILSSKYAKGTKALPHTMPGQFGSVTEYDFGNKDPQTLLTQEFLDNRSRSPVLPPEFPKWILSGAGKALNLPFNGDCTVPQE